MHKSVSERSSNVQTKQCTGTVLLIVCTGRLGGQDHLVLRYVLITHVFNTAYRLIRALPIASHKYSADEALLGLLANYTLH